MPGYFSHPTDDLLDLRIEVWDDSDNHVEETLACCRYIDAARAAYDAMVLKFPGKKICLRQRTRVIARNYDPLK